MEKWSIYKIDVLKFKNSRYNADDIAEKMKVAYSKLPKEQIEQLNGSDELKEKLIAGDLENLPKEPFMLHKHNFDPRFPFTNMTRACGTNYEDYHKCIHLRGEDFKPCQYFKRHYESLCLKSWIENMEERKADGVYIGFNP